MYGLQRFSYRSYSAYSRHGYGELEDHHGNIADEEGHSLSFTLPIVKFGSFALTNKTGFAHHAIQHEGDMWGIEWADKNEMMSYADTFAGQYQLQLAGKFQIVPSVGLGLLVENYFDPGDGNSYAGFLVDTSLYLLGQTTATLL